MLDNSKLPQKRNLPKDNNKKVDLKKLDLSNLKNNTLEELVGIVKFIPPNASIRKDIIKEILIKQKEKESKNTDQK